jgi:hypothetical protein
MDEKDDDPYDESKSEDHGEENGSANKAIQKSEQEISNDSLVKFREFRFEDCFKDLEWTTGVNNALIENAHIAQLDLAITTMQVLSCEANDPHYSLTRDLEEYSATYWDSRVGNLDIEKATDGQVSSVIKAMKAVFTAPETTSLALERQDLKMYDTFISAKMPTAEDPNEEKGVMMQWCMRAQTIGAERLSLSDAEFQWAENVIALPPNLLTPLAKEHVRHVCIFSEHFPPSGRILEF